MIPPSEKPDRPAADELYEDYPYPDHGAVSTVVYRLAREAIEHARGQSAARPLRILDAGCGTGEQSLGLARSAPQAEVVGVDLSSRSIERAEAYARRHGLAVRFLQADLLDDGFPEIGSFDVIVSVGVLHHLHDPGRALTNLKLVARPGASLVGMVYGRFGRRDTFAIRDAIELLAPGEPRASRLEMLGGIRRSLITRGASAAEALHRRWRFGPGMGVGEAIRRTIAGRNQSYRADCYTHSLELTFTWPELADMLSDAGWQWEGWPRRSGMPDDPAQLLRGTALERAREMTPIQLAAVYERLLRPANLYFTAKAR